MPAVGKTPTLPPVAQHGHALADLEHLARRG